MLSVDEALARVLAGVRTAAATPCAIGRAGLRHTCANVIAGTTHPPADSSAMDGYAVRSQDVGRVPARLRVVGEAPAGGHYDGHVQPGEAVRIFTGGPVPAGADAVVAQEDTRNLGGHTIEILEAAAPGKHIRRCGNDFSAGDVLVPAGQLLNAPAIALAAAGGLAALDVSPIPKVAILATGDELVAPGEPIGPHQIVASTSLGLAALIAAAGGEAIDLGIAPDDPAAIVAAARSCPQADMLVTTGGASVGERDFVQSALAAAGLTVDFWKIAMKPGKPLIFGAFEGKAFFGLPGNPVSALVCALLFLRPALLKFQGRPDTLRRVEAALGEALPATGRRQEYLRAGLSGSAERPIATAFPVQDSGGLKTLALSDALIVRPPDAPPAPAGAVVDVIPLAGIW